MTSRTPLVAILAGLMVVALGGCSGLWSHAPGEYATAVVEPRRDEAKAAALTEQAANLYRQGKTPLAEQTLQEALVADVAYGPAHNNLGVVYYGQGKYYLAAWEFEYARKVMPDRPEYLNNLGMVYEAVGSLDQAIQCYEAARNAAPQNAQVIGNLARAHLRRDPRAPEARDMLLKLLLYDTRPDWVGWAREQLAIMKIPENPSESVLPTYYSEQGGPARPLTAQEAMFAPSPPHLESVMAPDRLKIGVQNGPGGVTSDY